MRKSLLLLFLLLSSALLLNAQKLSVESFRALPNDMSASSLDGKRIDQNGDVAALIKVVTAQQGFLFEGGSLGIVDTKQEYGEIWVWVPHGLRKITIKHQQLGVLRDYYFPVEIEAERTYEMVLSTGTVETVVRPAVTQQFLVFKVTPKNALVMVNDMPWPVDEDGVAQKLVDFGKYTYRVELLDYHTKAGVVEVKDVNNKTMVEVTLHPAYGYLKVEGDKAILSQSSVFIDNAASKNVIDTPMKLSSGEHKVRIVHPMYKPYERTVTIPDEETFTLNVNMMANYATVTLQVDEDAEIYVNEQFKGIRQWTGDLESGNYLIECRKENHKSSVVRKTITENMTGQTIVLNPPTPITGRLVVSSTPSIAKLYVDGKMVGETPMQLNDLPIGKHELRIEKEGWVPLTKTILIEEDKALVVEERLETVLVDVAKTDGEDEKANDHKMSMAPVVERGVNFATLNVASSLAPQPSFGFTFGSVNRMGWFVTAMSNFNFKALNYVSSCGADGLVDGEMPEYTGVTSSMRYSIMAGMMQRLTGPLCISVGVGYGARVKCWSTTDGSLVKVEDDSYSGVDASVGLHLNLKGLVLRLDAVTTNFKTIEGKIGIGYCWKKR